MKGWNYSGRDLPITDDGGVSKLVYKFLLQNSLVLAQYRQRAQLIQRLLLTDLAHRKSDMHQSPVAGIRKVVLQQSCVDVPPVRRPLRPTRELSLREKSLKSLPVWPGTYVGASAERRRAHRPFGGRCARVTHSAQIVLLGSKGVVR